MIYFFHIADCSLNQTMGEYEENTEGMIPPGKGFHVYTPVVAAFIVAGTMLAFFLLKYRRQQSNARHEAAVDIPLNSFD